MTPTCHRIILSGLAALFGLALALQPPGDAQAGPYADSAHGDAAAGVRRAELPPAYAVGNCGNCHAQHNRGSATEPFALFARSFDPLKTLPPYAKEDVLCFGCHTALGSLQQGGQLLNRDYSVTFGGYPDPAAAGILEQFNQPSQASPSAHNLKDIWDYAQANFPAWFGPQRTPCSACHNPHAARANASHPAEAAYTALSRPTDRDQLWGDDPGERMNAPAYGGRYQAPYAYGSTTTFEPAGSPLGDGAQTPDYNTLCGDCHGPTRAVPYSTPLGRSLKPIDWSGGGGDSVGAGDKHGANSSTTTLYLRPPYGPSGGDLLSCLDCHEAHGSPNDLLMRRTINGAALAEVIDSGPGGGNHGNACRQCHQDDAALGQGEVNQWKFTHHGDGQLSPYNSGQEPSCGCHEVAGSQKLPIACETCHYHGSYVPNPANAWPGTVAPARAPLLRKTF